MTVRELAAWAVFAVFAAIYIHANYRKGKK